MPYEYYPPHDGEEGGGGGEGRRSHPDAIIVAYLQSAEELAKLLKKLNPQGEASADLIAEYEALISEH